MAPEKEANLEGFMTMTQALEAAHEKGVKVTRATMITWVEKNEIGFQPGGPGGQWWVSKELFEGQIMRLAEALHG